MKDGKIFACEDGLELFSAVHKPWPYPLHVRIWNWIKSIFMRPKFSKEAIEPYEPTKEEREYRVRILGNFDVIRGRRCMCELCKKYRKF